MLEFGSGWSTLVLCLALKENKEAFQESIRELRHPNKFEVMTVDCEHQFMTLALERIPSDWNIPIHAVETKAVMSVVNNQICTLYKFLPAFTADFVYLDGPDCNQNQVIGDINGYSLSFGDDSKSYGLPMSADLILLEPHFWPGTIIVTDGRGANARFLLNNFKRNWIYEYNPEIDQHIFSLDEPSWGKFSTLLLNFKAKTID